MTTIGLTKLSSVTRKSRILTLSAVGIASILMLGIAYTANAAMLYRQLDFGARGSDVSDLQTFLSTNASIYPSGLVTGYFGPLTQAGVERFQVSNGIVSSGTPASTGYGRVGPRTMAVINAQMGGGVSGFDRNAPAISSLSVSTSTTSATLNWNTSENSSAIVYFSTSPLSISEATTPGMGVTVSGSTLLVHSDLRTSHSGVLTGLQANTTYHYVVYVRDGSGNETITWPSTFKTAN
ncbi:MAG: fibronectin type III domain-containing protein [Minisyncoccia bacterium]